MWRADLSQHHFSAAPAKRLPLLSIPSSPAAESTALGSPERAQDTSPRPPVLGWAVRTRPSSMAFKLHLK